MFQSLSALANTMRDAGATKFYAKKLAPNDNNKNQPYLSKGFAALNVIPHGEIKSDSTKNPKAKLNFFWVSESGLEKAPGAQLILYPDYPEVRFSGFVQGTHDVRTKEILTCRAPGRVIVFGTCPDGRVIGYADKEGSPIQRELLSATFPTDGVLLQLTKYLSDPAADPLTQLLTELGRIHRLSPIRGQRLYAPPPGTKKPYAAQNAGGYTLEAELGILPNGRADPDFMGWEVKSFSVNALGSMKAKSPTTLMTPEPTIGVYAQDFSKFMKLYGYNDTKGRAGRRNFGGIYSIGKAPHKRTQLAIQLSGFDPRTGKISDMNAELALMDPAGNVAAGWRIKDIVEHWSRKHAQAVYVPAFATGTPREYHYGGEVEIGEGTDPIKFLSAIATKAVFLDPGVKIENGKPQKRNQFRVKHVNLPALYDTWSTVSVI